MTHPSKQRLRSAFEALPLRLVRIVPKGFLIDDELRNELVGTIETTHLVRKRFEARKLLCDSKDGVRARNGTLCEECLHPQCRPWLRLYLRGQNERLLLDLDAETARRLFEAEDLLEESGEDLMKWTLRLFVEDRGRYGQVEFARADD